MDKINRIDQLSQLHMDNINKNNDLLIFLEKYGVRYVIRNFKLTPEILKRIVNGEFNTIRDEEDITEEEINIYQSKFYLDKEK